MTGGLAVGVDVGGTKIAAGLVAEDGTLLSRARADTPRDSAEAIVDVVVGLAAQLAAEQRVGNLPLGVGAAGLVDAEGTVRYAPNLPLQDHPFGATLAERLQMPVVVGNDGNVAAWGEFRAGAARDVAGSVAMLTIGTGVGGGLVVDDRLALGGNGLGGEFGHIVVCEGGRPCPCGNLGCLEAYASGTAIGKVAQERLADGQIPADSLLVDLPEVTGKSVTVAAHRGDEAARDVVGTCGFWLGVGIASLANALDPTMVVIGGGAMQAGSLLLDPARASCRERVVGSSERAEIPIVRATLGDDAGVIGAGLLALDGRGDR